MIDVIYLLVNLTVILLLILFNITVILFFIYVVFIYVIPNTIRYVIVYLNKVKELKKN